MTNSGIYAITHRESGDQYIGSSVDLAQRWRKHREGLRRGDSKHRHLQSAWNKYGEEIFEFSVLLFCPPEQVLLFEQQLIDERKPRYNIVKIVAAPMTGRTHSAEAKAKVVASLLGNKRCLGNKLSDEHKKRIGAASKGHSHNKGYKHTEATKRKVAAASRGRLHTEHTKRRISRTLMGHAVSPATRAAVGKSNRSRVVSAETRRRMSEAHKRRYAAQRATINQEG